MLLLQTAPTYTTGTDVLAYINQGSRHILAVHAPTINVIGIRMVIGLATIMLVWYGLQEALSGHHGGGFHMGRFLNFFMLISFAYAFVTFYDQPIPGIGYSLTGFISEGTSYLADSIGTDSANTMIQSINTTLSKQGPAMTITTSPYLAFVYGVTQFMLAVLGALVAAVLAYGEIAGTAIALLGPIFIPWMVFARTDFLFWAWLRAYISFAFYKVIAAVVMSILAQFFFGYYQGLATGADIELAAKNFPILLLLIVINVFILAKIPAITASIFSGSAGGHSGMPVIGS